MARAESDQTLAREIPKIPTAPANPLPAESWDVHAHVFGPLDRFPTGAASYPIPLADPGKHLAMLDTLGVSYGVLVQPAPYGTDLGALENALRHGVGRTVGVGTADASCSTADLERMHNLGIRALRFNERIDSGTGRKFAGAIGVEALRALAPAMRDLGIHAQIWAGIEDCVRFAEEFEPYDIPLVFDHMAQPNVPAGIDDPSFQRLLELLTQGHIWVKLAVCRVGDRSRGYSDVKVLHEALVNANSHRLLWGSDWPFVRMGTDAPAVSTLVDLFSDWVRDETVRNRILVDNPRALFGPPGSSNEPHPARMIATNGGTHGRD
jgi:predicted TIM-barrel fold metal-dependent hydrolase